jgi:hypothetical protein
MASALLFTSSLLLVASMGFAQEESNCDDFAAPEDAQMALEENPDLANSLDGDGNGVACDEDPSVFTQAEDPEDTTESTNESTTGAERYTSPDPEDSGDSDSNDSNARSQQTPATGGVALIPLAGSALTALLGGSVLLRRRV